MKTLAELKEEYKEYNCFFGGNHRYDRLCIVRRSDGGAAAYGYFRRAGLRRLHSGGRRYCPGCAVGDHASQYVYLEEHLFR